MYAHAALLAPEADGGYSVTFRDIPEASTQGDSLEDARVAAVDALATAMDFYFEDGRKVPEPSEPRPGEEMVSLLPSIASQLACLRP